MKEGNNEGKAINPLNMNIIIKRQRWYPAALKSVSKIIGGIDAYIKPVLIRTSLLSDWYTRFYRRMMPWSGWSSTCMVLNRKEILQQLSENSEGYIKGQPSPENITEAHYTNILNRPSIMLRSILPENSNPSNPTNNNHNNTDIINAVSNMEASAKPENITKAHYTNILYKPSILPENSNPSNPTNNNHNNTDIINAVSYMETSVNLENITKAHYTNILYKPSILPENSNPSNPSENNNNTDIINADSNKEAAVTQVNITKAHYTNILYRPPLMLSVFLPESSNLSNPSGNNYSNTNIINAGSSWSHLVNISYTQGIPENIKSVEITNMQSNALYMNFQSPQPVLTDNETVFGTLINRISVMPRKETAVYFKKDAPILLYSKNEDERQGQEDTHIMSGNHYSGHERGDAQEVGIIGRYGQTYDSYNGTDSNNHILRTPSVIETVDEKTEKYKSETGNDYNTKWPSSMIQADYNTYEPEYYKAMYGQLDTAKLQDMSETQFERIYEYARLATAYPELDERTLSLKVEEILKKRQEKGEVVENIPQNKSKTYNKLQPSTEKMIDIKHISEKVIMSITKHDKSEQDRRGYY